MPWRWYRTAPPTRGRTREAIALGDRWVNAWRPGAHDDQLAVYLGLLGLTHYFVGSHERALEVARSGYELGLHAHAVNGTIFSGGTYGLALTGLGRHEEALAFLESTVALGRDLEMSPRFTAMALNCWTGVLRELYDFTEARTLNERGLELAALANFPYADTSGRIDLLAVDLAEGEVGRAQAAWPGLWEAALAGKGLHRWLMRGRLATARAEIALRWAMPPPLPRLPSRPSSTPRRMGGSNTRLPPGWFWVPHFCASTATPRRSASFAGRWRVPVVYGIR